MLLSGTDMRYYRSACVLELLIMRYIVESESDGCGVSDFHVASLRDVLHSKPVFSNFLDAS